MKIKRFINGSMLNNCYVLYQKDSGACYIIDPGFNPRRIEEFVGEHSLEPKGILLTHLHRDHTGASDVLRDALDCSVFMHEDDAFIYRGKVDARIKDGDSFDLEGERLAVIHTPGHTQGSICLYTEKSRACFTGDTVFDTDLGRTDLAGGSEAEMRESVRKLDSLLGNDVYIWPGHEEGCSMKYVREKNQEFIALL